MSDEGRKDRIEPVDRHGPSTESSADPDSAPPSKRGLAALPGLVGISFYLLLLSVVIVVGVVGGHYPAVFILLPVFLLAACGGLLMLFRWAWAMALAAVLMLGGYNVWIFAHLHLFPALVQGLLNMVFFFYLVRIEVREKLR
jgi:hypothetical protein